MIKAGLVIACVYVLLGCYMASAARLEPTFKPDDNSTAPVAKSKSGFLFNYYYPYYSYYNWYNIYPSTFLAGTCANYACPAQCPGTCGTYAGIFACRCQATYVSNLCTASNLALGNYLFSWPYDTGRYVQCGSSAGVYYIRNCPDGLVFDSAYGVCNYPAWWGKK